MNTIPEEFKDYMLTKSHLTLSEQEKKFTDMHVREIRERAIMLRNLDFDKEDAKKRIKQYIESGFELQETPPFYNTVDSIVNEIYKR